MANADLPAPKISIDGAEYELSSLTEQARAQMQNIRFCEERIRQLESEWAIADTARLAYSHALQSELKAKKAVLHDQDIEA
ncbi:hypothetical protein RAZWK3B_11682 [Roseobacter sp. AzwK-3b]|uniref:DUF6447 family protein n=1 Tax=Roseobacter sp. AzwK-3b TaxID=351016 RepID=UPI000156A1BC|nr:DUF6447 family protein [Roseobacter sp. AzwK-3b]EDM69397.1 hypothetical protein RAZWK3B_11682 [Roseobacter sp. AzwK-3b]